MSEQKFHLKPVSKLLIEEFGKQNIRIQSTSSYQLISAAFGLWAHELTTEYNVPFLTLAPSMAGISSPGPQFHQDYLIDRVKQLLDLDEWSAQGVASAFIDHLKSSGLRIDLIRLMFDPTFDGVRAMVFKAVLHKMFPPHHASVAIANGLLSPLPTSTLREHFEAFADEYLRAGMRLRLADFIAKSPTYIWRFPTPAFPQAWGAVADVVHGIECESAEIGLGFILIQPYRLRNDNAQRYSVVSLMYHHNKAATRPWSQKSAHYSTAGDLEYDLRSLSKLLPGGVASLPKIEVCATCRQAHSPAIAELVRTCNCPQIPGREAIIAAVDAISSRNASQITNIDVLREIYGEYRNDHGMTVKKSLNANRARAIAAILREHGFKEDKKGYRVNDDEGRKTTTVRWIFTNQNDATVRAEQMEPEAGKVTGEQVAD